MPDLELDCRVVNDVDMAAYEYQIDPRPAYPADLFPAGGDASVGAGDLGELLANGGSCPSCPADLYPVGSPDGTVGAGDLGQLLAAWGQCPRVSCSAEIWSGSSSEGDEVGWPEVEMTSELFDWIMSSSIDDIWDWMWSLPEQ